MFGSELMDMIGPGCSLVVGTVSAGGEPRATRAWATRIVDDDAGRVRVLMSADDQESVDNLAAGRVAVTGANVRTLRSVQLKGTVVCVEPPTPADHDLVSTSTTLFVQAIHETDGIPADRIERLLPADIVAVELVVEEMYDQSPGPDAGAAVRP